MKIVASLFFLIFCLSGCSSALRPVVLSPQYQGGFYHAIPKTLQLSVIDHRVSKFSIKVVDQEPQIYLPHAELPTLVERALTDALEAQKARVVVSANTRMTLLIKSLNARVSESLTQHTSNAVAEFEVQISDGRRQFNKTFSGKAELTGPLLHEQSKVENQLNNLIIQIITRMISDKEVIAFLEE